jgi:pyridoxamine 5'-phosphate oxidase
MNNDLVLKKAMSQLKVSLSDAKAFNDPQADNAYLATSGEGLQPSVRIITIHGIDDKGLFFLANKNSGKIAQINDNPKVGICFYWQSLSLQVTIEGVVKAIDQEAGEALWARRDHNAKITAWAFDMAVDKISKEELAYYKRKVRDNLQQSQPPLASSWSGFIIEPIRIEFWKADWRNNKCRDCYQKTDNVWQEFHDQY